jgi:3-methyl-2-oxobutanoate hydroxymethyltransferase
VSHQSTIKRITAPDIAARKGTEPIVVLTSYHAQTAALVDPHVDILMVGDSLGMVIHGMETTVPVPLGLMIAHAQAVVRGSERALVVVDMPFGSYEESPTVAFRSAARIMKETGCGAVKLEGGVQMAETIAYLTARGIPVMGHIGMTPQAVNQLGGFAARGRRRVEWTSFEQDARAVAEAGAFSVVIEAVAEALAARITQDVPIPTIGIGASPECDGQVLVLEDMLGLAPRVPKFVKEYAELRTAIEGAVKAYARDVRARTFPAKEHTYSTLEEVPEALKKFNITAE